MRTLTSPNTRCVNKFTDKLILKNPRGSLLRFDLVRLFACSAFVFSLHVVGIVLLFPLLSTFIYVLMCICFICFSSFLYFGVCVCVGGIFLHRPRTLLFVHCVQTVTMQLTLLNSLSTRDLAADRVAHSDQLGGCWVVREPKLKQYLSSFAFPPFSTVGSTEHTERTQSASYTAGSPPAMYSLVTLLWTTSVLKEINLLTLERFGSIGYLFTNTFIFYSWWSPCSCRDLLCHFLIPPRKCPEPQEKKVCI